ncbi:hypothetical protein KOI35_15685 [Actinoplanes bogorensis]|uniref:Uncharacterized protein n=1 Tax=Paractinoplanes bogorensis TaxID=1610840 RepID=A0ABS5YNA4_9ACTN|nr:hypothetical protein [Actinoplanes bogorensis]MBU2664944.1 hypothetical protein [Actinoplanes bogorensis]
MLTRLMIGPPRGTAPAPADHVVFPEDGDGWSAGACASPAETACSLRASAIAFVQSVEGADGTFVRSLVVQTDAVMRNPYVFAPVTLGVAVDVVDNTGVTLATFRHDASAHPWIDPRGNSAVFSWIDNRVMPDPRLNRIDHLRIRFANRT